PRIVSKSTSLPPPSPKLMAPLVRSLERFPVAWSCILAVAEVRPRTLAPEGARSERRTQATRNSGTWNGEMPEVGPCSERYVIRNCKRTNYSGQSPGRAGGFGRDRSGHRAWVGMQAFAAAGGGSRTAGVGGGGTPGLGPGRPLFYNSTNGLGGA